jgi:membrane fusion protein, multidrug efflux system
MATTIKPGTAQRPGRDENEAPEVRDEQAPERPRRRPIAFIVLGLAVLGLGYGGVRRLLWSRTHEATDDAQVDGHIVPILPKVGGFVTQVRVEDNQRVQAGDTLVVLDDADFRAKLAQEEADYQAALATVSSNTRVGQADATLRQAEANAQKAHADLERLQPLAERDIVSKQQLDGAQAAATAADAQVSAARAALAAADARVAAARATRDQAALQLSYTRVTAAMSGVVSKKNVEVGELVQPGQPLMSVVPLTDVWVVANYKETQVEGVTPGDPADITVDAYPGLHVAGHVESLSPATGAKFSLLPPDNATGNFTKVVQRVPVRIRLDRPNDPQHPLRPGMSVEATVTTKR